jgi:hypothetical protein
MSTTKPKPVTKRPELSAADIDRMVAFWSQLNITGTISHLFHETIDRIWSVVPLDRQTLDLAADADEDLSGIVAEVSQLSSTVAEHDRFFNSSIEDIHRIIAILSNDRQSKDDSIVTQQAEEISTLQQENHCLKLELAQIKSKFDTIASVIRGTAPVATTDIAQPPLSSPPTHKPSRTPLPKTGIHSLDSSTKIDMAIDAVIDWNRNNTENRLRISIPLLRALCLPMGCASTKSIVPRLKAREEEVDLHHSCFHIGERENRYVDLSTVLPIIARDYLKLTNWADVSPP